MVTTHYINKVEFVYSTSKDFVDKCTLLCPKIIKLKLQTVLKIFLKDNETKKKPLNFTNANVTIIIHNVHDYHAQFGKSNNIVLKQVLCTPQKNNPVLKLSYDSSVIPNKIIMELYLPNYSLKEMRFVLG